MTQQCGYGTSHAHRMPHHLTDAITVDVPESRPLRHRMVETHHVPHDASHLLVTHEETTQCLTIVVVADERDQAMPHQCGGGTSQWLHAFPPHLAPVILFLISTLDTMIPMSLPCSSRNAAAEG